MNPTMNPIDVTECILRLSNRALAIVPDLDRREIAALVRALPDDMELTPGVTDKMVAVLGLAGHNLDPDGKYGTTLGAYLLSSQYPDLPRVLISGALETAHSVVSSEAALSSEARNQRIAALASEYVGIMYCLWTWFD